MTILVEITQYKASAQTIKTVGVAGNYSTLRNAFNAINNGSITGTITLQIISNITDDNSAALNTNGSGSANYSSVLIYPTGSGYTISGNTSNPLIDLNGADNVTIDGRVNASGNTNDLIITNTRASTSASAVRFRNSAKNNTIKYCTIKGSNSSSGNGIIVFSTSSSGSGNDNNLIDNNNITSDAAGRPVNALYSAGTSGRENNNNTISNNNFYNFLSLGYSSRGINISTNSIDYTISGNSFYETTTIVPTANNNYNVISISTSVSHLVSGNYIGGSAPQCGGSPFTVNSNFAHYFYGIQVSGGTTTPVTIENNVIQNINYTSTNSNPWDGIYIASGVKNVNVTGNTIGSETGTSSIVINTPNASATATISGSKVTAINLIGGGSGFTASPTITFSTSGSSTAATATAIISGGVVTGYTITSGGWGYTSNPAVYFNGANYSTSHGIRHLSTGVVTISNNKIGAITTVSNNEYSHCLEPIVISGAAPSISITNNLIGSLTTANSIQASSNATLSPMKQDVRGIYVNSSVTLSTITGNTVANLTNNYLGTSTSKLDGICITGGSNTIQNNIIRNLSTGSSYITVTGIQQAVSTAGTNQTLTGNTIYNLSNTHTSAFVKVQGILFQSPTSGNNIVSENFVHSLSLTSSNVLSEITGITLGNGVKTCANNIINLGSLVTTDCKIYGIYDYASTSASNNNSIYFNTVYIGGIVSSGTASTGALWNFNNSFTRNYRNNILMNARSGGTGKHYAIRIAGNTSLTIDYNDYYAPSGVLGYISGADKNTLVAWQTATAQDINSLNIDPLFSDAGDTNPADYLISATLNGITISGITTDYSGISRGATPKIGALECNNYIWKGTTSTDFGTASNWLGGIVPLADANIEFDANPLNNCILDQNREVENITIAQSTYKLITNGFQLRIGGNLAFSNGAQIDATAAASTIVFGGNNTQNIPIGSFVNNTIDSLSINNINGLILNGDLTINSGIALNAGNFTIGPNTLTFNGIVTAMTGTVTGGSSTNMIIGGTGTIINMPSFVLNNLTINRASGVSLYGNLNLVGTLTLTNGTITINANTLTISGNSPTRTSGYIDASNTSASLVFTNTSAITLPASIFSTPVNNLTINGAGGITSSSDFSIDGILNLQTANPSAIKGSLDMGTNTLSMSASATTVGIGDVTGIVKRTSFVAATDYTFGNQFTIMTIAASGVMPTEISFKIEIGAAPSWKTIAVQRTYDIIQSGGSGTTVSLHLHYLDNELQSNTESNLVTWDYHATIPKVEEHGKANQNTTENWVSISNRSITYFGTSFNEHLWGLSNKEAATFVWQGTPSSNWNDPNNWTGGIVPSDTSNVIIPDAASTLHDPILPISPAATVKTISINNGGILDGNTSTTLTIVGSTGAWFNIGTFNAGTSTVKFTNANATMADPTNFYNVTIANGAALTPQTDNFMRISGALTLEGTGILRAALLPNTIEFNGADQTIINPNGLTTGYYNLILSGSGTKTLPATALSIAGDFTTSGTSSTTAIAEITVGGNFTIDTNATFNTGAFNHYIGGNFDNNGIFTTSSGNTITMNGNINQIILGSKETTFENLTINNINNVSMAANLNVNNVLTLTNGNLNIESMTLGINGTVSKTAGFINTNALSSLNFGGTNAFTITNDLFTNSPSINNLTINRTNGVISNIDLAINGILNLQSANPSAIKGSLDMGTNTLSMGDNATTIGAGDVTGIIKRTTINPLTTYTFGNQYTSAYFTTDGTLPTEMSVKVSIGTAPSWRTGAINREYEIIQSGGSGTKATFYSHYLDSELNSNNESDLALWVGITPVNYEYGRSNISITENWVALSNINVAFFLSSWSGLRNVSLDEFGPTTTLTWNGSLSDSWTSVENWTPNVGPSATRNIIIPDAASTPNDPTLPSETEIKTLTLEIGSVLNSLPNAKLTLNGGTGCWVNNGGTLNPNTSQVIFTNTAATITGTTNFFNLTINSGSTLLMQNNSTIGIAGYLTNNGTLNTLPGGTTTVEFNSNSIAQSIDGLAPSTTFNNLILNNTFSSAGLTLNMPINIANSLTLTYGNIITSGTNTLNMLEGSSANSGSANSFVDGPMTKAGTTAFVFPVGNGTKWARIGIGAPTASTTFTAQYFATAHPDTTLATSPSPALEVISSKEYWQLDRTSGTGNTPVTLYWENAAWSGIGDCSNNYLRIAHFNSSNSNWENNNESVTTSGSCSGASSGSITTNTEVTSFSPFTFGSILAGSSVLPIELLSFTGNYENKNIVLNWATISETNNAYFTLEKSINTTTFNSIAKVDGKGNSNTQNNYSHIDTNPYNGINYYRLRQTDFDGKNTTSKIIAINIANQKTNNLSFEIYPNPILASEKPTIKISNFNAEKEVLVVMYNVLGEELFSKIIITDYSGNSITAIDIENRLSAGTYLIRGTSLNQTYNKYLIIK